MGPMASMAHKGRKVCTLIAHSQKLFIAPQMKEYLAEVVQKQTTECLYMLAGFTGGTGGTGKQLCTQHSQLLPAL